jgi:histone-lysine N-methyltransferase SETMAR
VSGVYYADTLKTHLGNAVRKKRPEFLMKRWFLLQDNAQPHIAHVAMEALADIVGTPVEHPPYSPDLAPCDFWTFPTLKHELRGQKFSTDTGVKQATSATVRKMSGNGLLHVFEKWVGICKKCIACEGHYFEKETVPKPRESSDSE